MKPFTISILASVLALTTAVPFEKRVLVVQTTTNVVVKTVDLTTTVWVSPGSPTPQAHINNQHAHHHAHKNKNKIKQNAPAQKAAQAPAPAQPKFSPPEVYNPPAVQQPAAPAPAPVPVTPPTQSATPVNKPPPPPVLAPAPQAPAPAPIAQAKSNEKDNANSGSTANCGKVGMPCSGDITFYDTGLGACGWTNDGTTENVFALAHGMMGEQSNGNPFCGRSAEVTLDGKTVVGKLVDKCGGCEGQSIDLGHKMFQALAAEARGRVSDVKWHFID
ncbi:MAG: hypothetical protein Q9166_003529 [cf. Caloplaca sp. 2 TL-2023]